MAHWRLERAFTPGDRETADRGYATWRRAVGRSPAWDRPTPERL